MYPIVELDDLVFDFPEQLGTKEKFWLRLNERLALFKIGREGTGENWAEKIAAELAQSLHIPHAQYDLAVWHGRKGVVSPAFVPEGGRLILGNELLAAVHTDYPQESVRGVRDHTLGRVFALLSAEKIGFPPAWKSPSDQIKTAFDLFLGYLMLDAWIANQDRHHENWGLISNSGLIYLAPSYDHAASLGQNETDENRRIRLTTADAGRHICSYVTKARSAIYESKISAKPLLTLDLFRKAAERSPKAAKAWLEQLRNVPDNVAQEIFDQLPPAEISPIGKEFALTMLKLNKSRLLGD